MTDIYQDRYIQHQAKKREQLIKIFQDRTSQRIFNSKSIARDDLDQLLRDAALAPSSCNRQAIRVQVVESRDEKEVLSGLLVGGVGWVHRADKILLIFADQAAYKAQGELAWMPYLDAGVTIAYLQLAAEGLGIGSAYVNPNIRDKYKPIFRIVVNTDSIFCGAIAIGYYDEDQKAEVSPRKRSLTEK